MSNIFLDEVDCKNKLLPFTHTRHTADILLGLCSLKEKWNLYTPLPVTCNKNEIDSNSLIIPANVVPTAQSIALILQLAKEKKKILPQPELTFIEHPWHIFQYNDWAIKQDFEAYCKNKKSAHALNARYTTTQENIFIEEGAQLKNCYLNADAGPIFISAGAQIMEAACIRGPFFLGENSVVKMGAKIYGATSVGKHAVVGGEIKNSVIFNFSNKAHDGYLGDAVLGSWCNLGAGTSNSNVKNTGTAIKYYANKDDDGIAAGNKAGLLMGDYSRAAINSRFNSGTIVGVCCNIFTDVFQQKNIPNFTWGNQKYIFDKALRDIENWKKMKQQSLSKQEIEMLRTIFED